MINLKKATFAFFVGIGLATATSSALALPDICTCLYWKNACTAGDSQACHKFSLYRCNYFIYDETTNDYCGM